MPATTFPNVARYTLPPITKHDLEWADLAVIDLSKADTPEGRTLLSGQIRDALSTVGFFYVVNHGYTPEQMTRMFDIANVPFEQVDQAERQQYERDIKQAGSYQGYKPRAFWHVHNGVRDQIETYDSHVDVMERAHPEALRPFLPEIEAFARHSHFNIIHLIMRLIASSLELPEDTLVNTHSFDPEGGTWVRFMKYYPYSEEDESKTRGMWLKGHTDVGTLTILWSQPVSGLQLKCPDGEWRWIKHMDNALVINAGDFLEFLCGGYYKATIHRVIQPPADQRDYDRLVIGYFAVANDNVRLSPMLESPVLQRVGVSDRFKGDEFVSPMSVDFRKALISTYGQGGVKMGKQEGTEEQIVAGVVVKHYL